MANIYIDVGNTKIKINYNKDNYIMYFTNKINNYSDLLKKISNDLKLSDIGNVYLSSVVPAKTLLLIKVSKILWKREPILISNKLKINVKYNIDNINKLGSDLLCLSEFINTKGNNIIIVNLGTATTILHVKNNIFEGAIISPGLTSSFIGMINKASLLNEINLNTTNNNIGKNTNEAISIGLLNGHYEMIKGLIKKIDKSATVYISGGDYTLIKDLCNYIYVKEATIEGMKIVAKLNEK